MKDQDSYSKEEVEEARNQTERLYEEWLKHNPPPKPEPRYFEMFLVTFFAWMAIALAVREIFRVTLWPL